MDPRLGTILDVEGTSYLWLYTNCPPASAAAVVDDEVPCFASSSESRQAGFERRHVRDGIRAPRVMRKPPIWPCGSAHARLNGLDLLRQIAASVPMRSDPHDGVCGGRQRLKRSNWAREYLTKPFDFDRLREVLINIREEIEASRAGDCPERRSGGQLEFCGCSAQPGMQEVFSRCSGSRPTEVVLVRENRHWQELVRAPFHQVGARRSGRSSPSIVGRRRYAVRERVFGHVRGAFTGVWTRSPVSSNRTHGTLFLDEGGELPHRAGEAAARSENGEVTRGIAEPSAWT